MYRIIFCLLAVVWRPVWSQELITIYSPYPSGYTLDPALFKIIERANSDQNRFKFVLERKPGADTLLALRALDAEPGSMALIGAPFVRLDRDNFIRKENYQPVLSFGEACWAVVSTLGDTKIGVKSLATHENLIWGVAGKGSASHLTSLELSQMIKKPILAVMYKSAADASIALIGDHGINITLMTVRTFKQYIPSNSNMKMLGMHCSTRHPMAPEIVTLGEQGLIAPAVFNTIVVHTNMPDARKKELQSILTAAMISVGQKTITELTDFTPPVFRNLSSEQFHTNQIKQMQLYLDRHQLHLK